MGSRGESHHQAAQLLYQEWGDRPLYIALSGGVDSELTARIFVKNNIPFTPVIVKIDGLNNIETWYAEYWCHINNITPIILNYSIKEIIDHTARLSAKLTQIKNCFLANSKNHTKTLAKNPFLFNTLSKYFFKFS